MTVRLKLKFKSLQEEICVSAVDPALGDVRAELPETGAPEKENLLDFTRALLAGWMSKPFLVVLGSGRTLV